jgi:sRNA-binding carbon storage regulator CsrA
VKEGDLIRIDDTVIRIESIGFKNVKIAIDAPRQINLSLQKSKTVDKMKGVKTIEGGDPSK